MSEKILLKFVSHRRLSVSLCLSLSLSTCFCCMHDMNADDYGRDNFLIMEALFGAGAYYLFPSAVNIPLFNAKGLLFALLIHISISETFFYLSHRLFHSGFLYQSYHSLHHSILVPQPYTGLSFPLSQSPSFSFFFHNPPPLS